MFELAGYLDLSRMGEVDIQYVSLLSQYENKWVIIHDKELDLWDCPGGRIEENEKAIDAAKRELWEETGAVNAMYYPLFIYAIRTEHGLSYGIQYFAKIIKFEAVPDYEIDRIEFVESIEGRKMRSPEVHNKLIRDLEKILAAGIIDL